MNIVLIASLLGGAAFALEVHTYEEVLNVSVTVWPPGSNIYLGECVLLQCTVESNSSLGWSYRWIPPHAAHTPNPRHQVSGDSYSISAVRRQDAGSYRCRAERRDSNATTVFLSRPAVLSVRETPPTSLLLTPNTQQMFRGESFTVRCLESQTNSSSWTLKHFPLGRPTRTRDNSHAEQCPPARRAVGAGRSDACSFTDVSGGNSGLYWCEGAKGRSNAVNITISYGSVILKTPAAPVSEGDHVVLYCQYWTDHKSKTSFFRNGAEMVTNSSVRSDSRVTEMTIENVTQADEGSYKCASEGRMIESQESWLSVRRDEGKSTSTDETADEGSWKWILLSCGIVLVFLTLLAVLAIKYRYQMFGTSTWWPVSKENLPAVELPATKQDVSEVQWDLSWMEMSNLLDKPLHPGT